MSFVIDLYKKDEKRFVEIMTSGLKVNPKFKWKTSIVLNGILFEDDMGINKMFIHDFGVKYGYVIDRGFAREYNNVEFLHKYLTRIYGEEYLNALKEERINQKEELVRNFDKETDRLIKKLTKVHEKTLNRKNNNQGVTLN